MTTIYVTIFGIVVPCDVTKTTTCYDVIRLLTSSSRKRDFAMFESTSEKEKLLPMESPVLKVITSWGAEGYMKLLVIRPVDEHTCRLASMSRAQRRLYRLVRDGKSSARRVCTGLHQEADGESFIGKSCTTNDSEPDEVRGKLDIMSRFLLDIDLYNGWSNSRLEAVHYANENETLTEELSVRTCCDGKDREHEAGSKQERKFVTFRDSDEDGLSNSGSDVSEFNKCFIASFDDTCAADFQYQHCLSAGEKRDMGLRGGVLSPR
ncbi:hypothetical protein DPMN_124316 [Dreissena polymorpha]|uniref:Uncharacterized protein n=1 Tax=Dreissena polymorpha TaxID=45954 RepID=A0A9D4JW44_DREPO|nr:hypothetical protein DPMN_124316 [Dreissena polymorpha]